ncbi:hypothetical protein FGB62_107g116 [Gracilaria domingensis]|nr:hypothetical protein FGB62_107g116 [Gracilaria domingensis]
MWMRWRQRSGNCVTTKLRRHRPDSGDYETRGKGGRAASGGGGSARDAIGGSRGEMERAKSRMRQFPNAAGWRRRLRGVIAIFWRQLRKIGQCGRGRRRGCVGRILAGKTTGNCARATKSPKSTIDWGWRHERCGGNESDCDKTGRSVVESPSDRVSDSCDLRWGVAWASRAPGKASNGCEDGPLQLARRRRESGACAAESVWRKRDERGATLTASGGAVLLERGGEAESVWRKRDDRSASYVLAPFWYALGSRANGDARRCRFDAQT